jgi:hypothetical protein
MLDVFWVILGREVVRLGRAPEEVSAGRSADDVDDVTFGRSVGEAVSVVLASGCVVVGEVVVLASVLFCVVVAPGSSPVVCGVCDVVVPLASFFWAVT